ncbi:hypothetical protein U9M48_013605 [Paspalum notatum var. saurae]|uniref:Uncharacterized protein n=1 Tax=Paspalum notatum var. saurae TaxID=547442 RepID=A0AAQ3SZS5_PASNO
MQEAQNGVVPSFIDVYVYGHRGSDPTNQEVLCTKAGKEKMVYLWHRGCGLQPECISSKEIEFIGSAFSLLKDSSRYPGRGGRLCSMRGGSSGNTDGYHSSIGTGHKLATLLPSSNVSAAGVDRVGATTPGVAATSGVDDGTPALAATSNVDGTAGLPATSAVDGIVGCGE